MTQTQTQPQEQKQQAQTQVAVAVEDTQKLEEVKKLIEEKHEANIVPVELNPEETQQIEETFQNVKDFRELGERITAPIDNIIEKTSKIIENDPIMDVSNELEEVNHQVQSVYKEIIDDD
jgi:hypothetical protein